MSDVLRTVNQGHMTDGPICWCNPRYFVLCYMCYGEDKNCEHCDEHGMLEIFDVEPGQSGVIVLHSND